jgi:hypothetical protein
MANKKQTPKDKPDRQQFGRGSTAEQIADAIGKIQDEWAWKYPESAHRLYPEV